MSDTLSRASLPIPQLTEQTPDCLVYSIRAELDTMAELKDTQQTIFVSDERLERIREETKKDVTLQTLMNVTLTGWPDSKTSLPLCIREYWPYRDEMTAQDGWAYRGNRIVISQTLRTEILYDEPTWATWAYSTPPVQLKTLCFGRECTHKTGGHSTTLHTVNGVRKRSQHSRESR